MKASLAVAAVRNAIVRRNPVGTVVHSDRGSQFRSNAFVRALADHGLVGSMGRVGACGDNAAMESFFALLQKNVLDRQRWATREDLRLAIITWIERTYHRRRRQRRLGRLTPVEYETLRFSHLLPRSSEVRTRAAATMTPMRCGQTVTRSRARHRPSRALPRSVGARSAVSSWL